MCYQVVRTELIKTEAATKAVETAVGATLDTRSASRVVFWIKYTKGDETSVTFRPYFLHTSGGDEFQQVEWSTSLGDKSATAASYTVNATGNYYIVLDTKGVNYVKLTEDALLGTPTGTTEVYATIVEE
ncbi:hypothetical protein D6833_04155 [Candidatus Parcubacteria bacterium]|nr:MAG: hypothetical protein D6833_04155 [Candidatus Parcubacteria bacterium]